MKRIVYCLLLASLALMTSCLGASMDIVMRADGSGSVTLEYSVSQTLESLGRQDGNERWPVIPVGKADFERSVARIPGLRLSSFSVKEYPRRYSKPPSSWGPMLSYKDLVTKVKLDFKDTAALLAFLDSAGSRASLVQEGGKSTLRLVLLDPINDAIDADLISLLQEISAGYEISVSFTAPKGAALSVIPPSVSAARTAGKKVSFAIGTGELIGMKDGLTLEISW